jgi:hypothetical protein
MKSFKVLWTDGTGVRRASVVSYSATSAEDRKQRLVAEKMNDVVIVPVFPPKWSVDVEQPKPKGRVVQRKHTVK